VGPNPTLKSYESYLSAAFTNHQPMIANTLLVWYILLGGHVEEETIWAVDKSYVVVSLSFPSSAHLRLCTPVIRWNHPLSLVYKSDERHCQRELSRDLHYLLEFLAAWEKRPLCLTPIAYQWCSAISEAAGSWGELTGMREGTLQPLRLKLQDPTLVRSHTTSGWRGIFKSWTLLGIPPLGNTSHRACGRPQDLTVPPFPLCGPSPHDPRNWIPPSYTWM
jgi:hypothetical protein